MSIAVASTLGIINNSLGLKEKLFKDSKRTQNLEPKKDKYCSVFLEHFFTQHNFTALNEQKLELTLCQRSDFTIPIRHLDWVIWEGSLEKIKVIDFEIPKLWSLPSQACILNIEVSSILNSRLKNISLSGRQLRKTVRNIQLQCVYADGHRQALAIPDSLQLAVFYKFYQSKWLFNWHQFLILHT